MNGDAFAKGVFGGGDCNRRCDKLDIKLIFDSVEGVDQRKAVGTRRFDIKVERQGTSREIRTEKSVLERNGLAFKGLAIDRRRRNLDSGRVSDRKLNNKVARAD